MMTSPLPAALSSPGGPRQQPGHDQNGAQTQVQVGQPSLERAPGHLVREAIGPAAAAHLVQRGQAARSPPGVTPGVVPGPLLVAARAAPGGGTGPGVEGGEAGLGDGEAEEQQGGGGEGGQAQDGDEEGGGAEEGEQVGDAGEDGQGEEEGLVLLVGGGVLLGEGVYEGFLLCGVCLVVLEVQRPVSGAHVPNMACRRAKVTRVRQGAHD